MKSTGKIIFGFTLILVGIVLLGRTLDLFYLSFGDLFSNVFPLVLIGFGLWHIMHRRKKSQNVEFDIHTDKFNQQSKSFHDKANNFESKFDEFDTNLGEKFNKFESKFDEKINKFDEKISDFDKKVHETFHGNGKVKYDKFVGDLYIDCKGKPVQNIQISMFIGEIEVRLHDAIYASGLNRLIISSFIGDIRIFAPKELPIFVNCSNFIGDIEAIDKRASGFGNSIESQTSNYDTAEKKLYIASNNFIGDIKVYRI